MNRSAFSEGLALCAAGVVMIGSWIYCVANYGFLFGMGLGWLPGIILAAPTFFAVRSFWLPMVLVLILSAGAIFQIT